MRVVRVLLLLVALPLFSAAQKDLRIGIRVMPMFSGIRNAEDADSPILIPQTTTGFAAGISVGYNLGPKGTPWEIELSALYSSQGQKYQLRDSTNLSIFRGYSLNLAYVKFPLLVKYRIPIDDQIAVAPYLGPQIGLRVDAQEKISDTLSVDYTGTGIAAANKYSGLDFSIVVGAELQFRIQNKAKLDRYIFFSGFRLEYGLTDVEDKDVTWSPDQFGESRYYDAFYGPRLARSTPRTETSRNIVFGATVGLSIILNTTRNPNDYYW